MNLKRRPFLVIPKLIQQPTWGGTRIVEMKSWTNLDLLVGKRIGQSYELFGDSKILVSIGDTNDPRYLPELGWAENSAIVKNSLLLKEKTDYVVLSDIVRTYPTEVLGRKLFGKLGKMPLLIKATESKGNSYQIHIKPSAHHKFWQPKAESWYYFDDGLITFGLKQRVNLSDFKKTCLEIESKIKLLSRRVVDKKISLNEAEEAAKDIIAHMNPKQFVNFHQIKNGDLVDLSPGGIHHSWEEDPILCPKGNFLYEVQQDVMDPVSTIRCFDQGKFKKDGTVRPIHINDYFEYLDQEQKHNNLDAMRRKQTGTNLLNTPYYSLDVLKINNSYQDNTSGSFVHLFVKNGRVEVAAEEGSVFLSGGHSCFIPEFIKKYEIKSREPESVILKTYISL